MTKAKTNGNEEKMVTSKSTYSVQLRDIDNIKPYERNPRLNDNAVDAVAASLQEFGFRQVVNAIAFTASLRIEQIRRLNPRYKKFRRAVLRKIARKLKMRWSEQRAGDFTYNSAKRDWLVYQQEKGKVIE